MSRPTCSKQCGRARHAERSANLAYVQRSHHQLALQTPDSFLAAAARTPIAASNPLAARASPESTLCSLWLSAILAMRIRPVWGRPMVAARWSADRDPKWATLHNAIRRLVCGKNSEWTSHNAHNDAHNSAHKLSGDTTDTLTTC